MRRPDGKANVPPRMLEAAGVIHVLAKVVAFNLAGDAGGEVGGIEVRDVADPAPRIAQRFPRRVDIISHRGHTAQARHHHSASHGFGSSLCL